ncbi:MAG: DEAD/DEAH box helicase [Spirochaetales bacterium]
MSAFARLAPLLQDKIVSNLGWTSLRPVQNLAAQVILDGKNCVVLAPTAGGKTEAAFFPVLSGCLSEPADGLRALYVCPTRALINNQEERLGRYASMVGLSAFKWHGDVTASEKKQFLKEPGDLILTTPESLEVLLISQNVPTAKLLHNLRYVVVDEIHALAACDRGNHLISVLERLQQYSQFDIQRIGLSATVGNPDHIRTWLQGSSKRESALVDPPRPVARRQITISLTTEPRELEVQVVKASQHLKSLLFCESRRLAERIAGTLKGTGEPVFVHHSSLSKEEREESELQFNRGKEACIVCTSTMELGIDVGDLDRVLQINAPNTVSSFLQRMGRTGRREGATANTAFFIEDPKFLGQAISIVELARSGWVENVRTNPQCWHILLHQLMALCLERGGITKDQPWDILHPARCFEQITREAYDEFFDFLVGREFLHSDGGNRYSLGLQAEKTFGRRNFMEMYSVFTSPAEFEVIGLGGDVIGTVEWKFLERLLEDHSSFYLSGSAWAVERIEWKRKVVFVSRATSGQIPKWGGISPVFLSYELCRKKRDLLVSKVTVPYLDEPTQQDWELVCQDKRTLLASSFAPVEQDDKGLVWHTYAGGNVNNTLRFALKIELDVDVQATNELVRIIDPDLTDARFSAVTQRFSDPEYWQQPDFAQALIELMPDYRLSKFQDYLPPERQRQLVADTILDVGGVLRFMAQLKQRP